VTVPTDLLRPAIVVHGGAGGSIDDLDACTAAARAGVARLRQPGQSLDAVIAAVVALEDDGRFNAGSGADVGLDGETIEMDAAVMDSRGWLGAVACLPAVRNPVLVARAVGGTPHWLLAGAGALRFAQAMELHRPVAVSERARARHRAVMQRLGAPNARPAFPGADNDVFRRFWNYSIPWQDAVRAHAAGTVGAVARDAEGHFAVATSTGGSAPSLEGRVGDTPIVGCGFYAGPKGAVAVTGIGEFIVRQMTARRVYDWIEAGEPLQAALDRAVAGQPADVDIGIIGITATAAAASSNRAMPHAIAGEEED
jgi:L-asparaginase/beta-aspartyl-peptidase (threonine type)